jgi:hypothetical protein
MRSMAAIAVAVFGLSVSLFAQNAAPPRSPATLVTVNTEPITQTDLDRARRTDAAKPLGRVLVDLVDERLVVQRGKNLGYELTDPEYQRILEYLKRQNKFTSDEELDAALTRSNMTRMELRTNLERSAIASRVLETEGLSQISDEDAQRYFNTHLDEFPLQTFELAKSDVIQRLKADATTRNVLVRSYLQSLRRGAAIVWAQPDLQQAYEQAAQSQQ